MISLLSISFGYIQNIQKCAQRTQSNNSRQIENVTSPRITEIPKDLLIIIFSELSREDLLAVAKTCKLFANFLRNPRILSNMIGKANNFKVIELIFISKIPEFKVRGLYFDTISNQTKNNQEIGQVIEAFPKVQELTLMALHDQLFYNIEKISQLHELKYLHLYIKRQLKFPEFKHLKNLKSLILHNQVDKSVGQILDSCEELSYLSLYSCSVGFETGKKIGQLQKLTTLNLNSCKRYLIIGKWLKNCKNLKHLKISYVEIGAKEITKIESLNNLRTLYLKGCDNITYQDLDKLTNLTHLKVIYIRNCQQLPPKEIKHIGSAELRIEDWNYELKNASIRQKLMSIGTKN